MDEDQHPHRRYNALTGDWILVSPHRTQRPWQGRQESAAHDARPAHDPNCYLCSGNERAGGAKNTRFMKTLDAGEFNQRIVRLGVNLVSREER